ncbi:hypothetical protein E2C01_044892 [Portunus trituberculatus]|uniref:Uncharacterized protein n=1 Tax=Portunus trituberculatus TaxID=210409 RepID=A0A5B7G0D8_PORTR|nr:hypothetical protein [Portunus trituberculatus]
MAKSKRERRVSAASTWGFPDLRPSFPSTAPLPPQIKSLPATTPIKNNIAEEKAAAAAPDPSLRQPKELQPILSSGSSISHQGHDQ